MLLPISPLLAVVITAGIVVAILAFTLTIIGLATLVGMATERKRS